MTWFKVDDGFHNHPKTLKAGTAAVGLYCRCGSYAAQQLTDGFIPSEIAAAYGTPEWARRLVEVGLWEVVDGGYQMPDFLDYNPSKEKVLADRKAKSDRQKRWRETQKRHGSSASTDASRDASPSRPDPPPSGERVGVRKSPAKPRLIHSWCGECDEQSRMVERDDGRLARCPRCSSRSVS